MKIITDGFKALDAMHYAQSEGFVFAVTKNTITAKQKLLPKMNVFQIRTKNIDADTLSSIKSFL